tara:strand:+ start:118 stop:339 length:222 start_codon:yes stop_codon:yes gene_type:complete
MKKSNYLERKQDREKALDLVEVHNKENKQNILIRIDDKTTLIMKNGTSEKDIARRVTKFKKAREDASRIIITK